MKVGMHTLLVILVGFLTLVQPRSASGYFTAGQAAAQFSWQLGHWVLAEPKVAIRTPTDTSILLETIRNPLFTDQLHDWEHTGAVIVEQSSPCDQETRPVVRIGSQPHEQQTLQPDNELTQAISSAESMWLAIKYCIVSWETLPLFDEPSLTIRLADNIVWEDAPVIDQNNQVEPFVSGWRTATVPIPSDQVLLDLEITAGNSIDPTNATVVYIASVSTAGWVLPDDVTVTVSPALAARTVTLKTSSVEPLISSAKEQIVLPDGFIPTSFGVHQLVVLQESLLGSETKQEFFLLRLPPPIESPSIWLEPDSFANTLTLYFTAAADADQHKFARYAVWKRTSDGAITKVPIQAHSFLWSTPRIPNSQEYLTVEYDPVAEYTLELVDQFGVGTFSDWHAVEVQ